MSKSRPFLPFLLLAALGVASGCTTSRAVQLWHEGWHAEQKGDKALAMQRYGQAYERDGRQYGAELGRIRLLLQQPDQAGQGQQRLDKLLKVKGQEPEVAALAALAALARGDHKLARQRLDAVRALKPTDPGHVAAALRAAELTVLAHENRWKQVKAKAAEGLPRPEDALVRAVAAWNAGDAGAAEAALAVAPAVQATLPARAVLQALLARQAGAWRDVETALAPIEGDDVTPLVLALRAEAALQAGEAVEAAGLAAEAARLDPASAYVHEVWAVAQLQAGQATLARDLLIGLTARAGGWSAWFHLGVAHVRLGDLRAATTAFAMAAQRCPTCKPPQQNLAVLARLGFGAR